MRDFLEYIVEMLKNITYGVVWAFTTPMVIISTMGNAEDTESTSTVIFMFILVNVLFTVGQLALTKRYKNARSCMKAFWILVGGIGFYSALYYLNKKQGETAEPISIELILTCLLNIVWMLQSIELNIISKAVKIGGRKSKTSKWRKSQSEE